VTTPRIIVGAIPGMGRHAPDVSGRTMVRVLDDLEGCGWDRNQITWVDVNPYRGTGLDRVQARMSDVYAEHTLLDAAHAYVTQAFGDVLAYLRTWGEPIRRYVLDALTPWRAVPGAIVVLVAHSLGGVVAYDALLQYQREHPDDPLPVGALITMGSPLHWAWAGTTPEPLVFEAATSARPWLHLASPMDEITARLSMPGLWGEISGQIEDVSVCTGLDPISAHTGYLDNARCARHVAQHLDELRR